MPGEVPFFIEGQVVEIISTNKLALVKVPNGNIYHIHDRTPGIKFSEIEMGQIIKMEVTLMLSRVLSAEINRQ